jgi:hypothetical protein
VGKRVDGAVQLTLPLKTTLERTIFKGIAIGERGSTMSSKKRSGAKVNCPSRTYSIVSKWFSYKWKQTDVFGEPLLLGGTDLGKARSFLSKRPFANLELRL